MKILLFSHKFFPDIGGIESVSRMLAESLSKMGHTVTVITHSPIDTAQEFQWNGRIIRAPSVRSLLKLAFSDFDISLEVNPCFQLSWPVYLFSKKRKRVVSLHTWLRGVDGKLRSIDKLKRWLINYCAGKVIACSSVIKADGFPDATVIGNPYDATVFQLDTSSFERVGFVFVGRLVSDKGVDIAIKAIKKIVTSDENRILSIIGDGPEMENLKKKAKDLSMEKHVKFLGALRGKALVDTLNKHKFIIVPSRWKEPFGIVALEGMACGCIPIVADGGGLPEAIEDAGLVFERNNVHDLVEKMNAVMKNLELQDLLLQKRVDVLVKHQADVVASLYLNACLPS